MLNSNAIDKILLQAKSGVGGLVGRLDVGKEREGGNVCHKCGKILGFHLRRVVFVRIVFTWKRENFSNGIKVIQLQLLNTFSKRFLHGKNRTRL